MCARASLSLCCFALFAATAASARAAAPTASLHVGLSPERLGDSTTISFAFTIAAAGQELPPALTLLDVRLPPGMGVDTRGVAICQRKALSRGPQGCSPDSRIGAGSVDVKVPLGTVIRPERAVLTVFNAAPQGGRTTLLFDAVGRLPIATQLIFPGVIVPGPLGQTIQATIPLIPTLPEAPDAAIVAMSSTLGTRHRAYYRTVGRRRVRIAPKGAILPRSCPSGGLPFVASFGFDDSSTAAATASVACSG